MPTNTPSTMARRVAASNCTVVADARRQPVHRLLRAPTLPHRSPVTNFDSHPR